MPNLNTRFTLAGEKEYRNALTQINAALKELSAEMRGTAQDFEGNADSIEALSATNDVLARKIETQKEKIALLQGALQSAGETYGEADAKTIRWKTSLIDAETELKKMEKTLQENEEAIFTKELDKFSQALDEAAGEMADAGAEAEDAADSVGGFGKSAEETKKDTVGLGDALGGAADKLGIKLPDGAKKALDSLNGVSAGTAAAVAGFAAVAAAVVKVEKALIDMTKEAAESAKEIETLAAITGQSTTEVQQMEYAAEKLGVSYDRVKDSLKEITNKMQEAENGSEDTAAAFDKLGVKLRDYNGELRDAQDVFLDVVDSLSEIENQSERDAIAMDLMSESAQELNPMIEAGREQIEAYAQAASDMGLVMEEDELAVLTDVQSAFYDLQQQQEATKNHLAAEFAPYLTSFYNDMGEATSAFGDVLEDSGIVTAFGELLQFVGELIDPASTLGQTTLPMLEGALKGVALALAVITDTLRAIVGLVDGLGDYLDTGSTSTWKSAFSFKSTSAIIDTWDAASTSTSRGGFGGGRSGSSGATVNNYYTVNGANARTVAQIEKQAQSARQTNRSYGGA